MELESETSPTSSYLWEMEVQFDPKSIGKRSMFSFENVDDKIKLEI